MKLTAGQAAKETGKSIPTIVRAYNKRLISGEKLPDGGGYLFDASEVFRVFPRVTPDSDDTPPKLGHETPNDTGALEVEVRFLRERLAEVERHKDDVIADLRRRLDTEGEERRRLTALLTHKPETPAPAAPVVPERRKPRWWPFGRAND